MLGNVLFRGLLGTTPVVLSLKDRSFSLSLDEHVIFAWDLGGRLYTVYEAHATWRRGLNGRILHKWHGPDGRRRRQWLPSREADRCVDRAASEASRLLASLASTAIHWLPPLAPADRERASTLLDRAARFDARRAREDAGTFSHVYQPIGILPPDQYLSLVVQATQGCSFNTCTFCSLYREPYQVKTPEQFRRHVRDVRDFLGASMSLRHRSVFLGAANALAVPQTRLLALLQVLREELPQQGAGPLAAFLDGFTGELKTARDYVALAEVGLRRVYIGLESGHDPLLAFVRKPSRRDGATQTVRALKEAGIEVGVIVLIGLGGVRFADAHVRDTIDTLSSMALDGRDLLYTSELVEMPGTPYASSAADAAIQPLDAEQRQRQLDEIRSAVRSSPTPPRVAAYDILDFIY
jgi:hypothetical protein